MAGRPVCRSCPGGPAHFHYYRQATVPQPIPLNWVELPSRRQYMSRRTNSLSPCAKAGERQASLQLQTPRPFRVNRVKPQAPSHNLLNFLQLHHRTISRMTSPTTWTSQAIHGHGRHNYVKARPGLQKNPRPTQILTASPLWRVYYLGQV